MLAPKLLAAGYDVVVTDISAGQLEAALSAIETNLARQAAKGVIDEAAVKSARARIQTSVELAALSDCDMVIEAASEVQGVKKEIFAQLKGVLKPSAILASNTSSLSITGLAAGTTGPALFVASMVVGMGLFHLLERSRASDPPDPVQSAPS